MNTASIFRSNAVTREELEREVIAQHRRLGCAIKAAASPAWMEIDLTLPQLRTLLILAEEGPLVIGRIAQKLGIGLSTGGHLVDRLVQAGLAERTEDSKDHRRTLAQLTPQGEDLYIRLLDRMHYLQTWVQKLNEDELAALLRGLQGLNRVAEEQSKTVSSRIEESTLNHMR
jgi:DNA-binding MarR family transcriptional regulator